MFIKKLLKLLENDKFALIFRKLTYYKLIKIKIKVLYFRYLVLSIFFLLIQYQKE
jgi:hypothetical protein